MVSGAKSIKLGISGANSVPAAPMFQCCDHEARPRMVLNDCSDCPPTTLQLVPRRSADHRRKLRLSC